MGLLDAQAARPRSRLMRALQRATGPLAPSFLHIQVGDGYRAAFHVKHRR